MKKKLIGALLVLALLASLCASASADHLTGSDGWLVTFTAAEKMETNFDTGAALSESYAGLQPGDDITLTVTLRNDHTQDTDWYMTNNVLKSLEDEAKSSQAHGAGYTYRLTYTSPKGDVRVLFDSENVGGEAVSAAGEGLHEATSALKDYFFLDTLASKDSATITLFMMLDGESQGNDYQDTNASLKMNFAVELKPSTTPRSPGGNRPTLVRTGDETNLMPAYIVMAVSGLLFLAFAVDGVRQRRKEGGR